MRAAYTSLAEHPRLSEVEAVLQRLPYLTDAELTGLAGAWRNTSGVAKARAKALSPDTLLVVDVLRGFADISQLFSDDLDGDAPYLGVPAATVGVALKAVRDALAGTIARPVLSRRESAALRAPWEQVVTPTPVQVPAPRREVDQLLGAVAALGSRCHDTGQATAFERILFAAMSRDREAHGLAVTAAFDVALQTGRRRTWSLLRERVEGSVLRGSCRHCPRPGFEDYDRERVASLCADAVGGLLVAETLPGPHLDLLLEPLAGLVPYPRPPLGA